MERFEGLELTDRKIARKAMQIFKSAEKSQGTKPSQVEAQLKVVDNCKDVLTVLKDEIQRTCEKLESLLAQTSGAVGAHMPQTQNQRSNLARNQHNADVIGAGIAGISGIAASLHEEEKSATVSHQDNQGPSGP